MWKVRRAVELMMFLSRSESPKPGTWTSTRLSPWRWMVGSVVPSSSMRLRMTSMDWATSAFMRWAMPSSVRAMTSLPSGRWLKASSLTPMPPISVLPMEFCSVSICARA
jgi:hypothetical protein